MNTIGVVTQTAERAEMAPADRRKLLVVVSEFPKITETFAYRNLVEYDRMGHEPWLFHIKPYRHHDKVHAFFEPLMHRVFSLPYLGASSLLPMLAEWIRAPRRMACLAARLIRAHWREPKRGLAVAALYPKAVALGRWCRAQGIDHVHGEFAGHPANAAFIASQVGGVPFSFTAHANDIFVSQAMLVDKAQAARFIRSISAYNIRFLSELEGFPTERLKLIRCGVVAEQTRTPAPEAPDQSPDGEGLRILYVGSLIEKKGVRHLLEALAQLPTKMRWRARIVGGGDLAAALQAQAEALGLGARVQFNGPQTAEEVAAAHRWAHVLVVPSIIATSGRVEGIPVVLMEAMGHGRAVIASALSGIPELVEDGQTGWLTEAGDASHIANALQEIAGDWPRAAAIAAAGQARIQNDYLISENARALAAAMTTDPQRNPP
ncbi:hypothetical protein AB838_04705 [Rhodobacteraceae bacterium (ex Bugula neritina AB1)]|nr:hypothetical protein AB838_04705 [Rhodobacteraceae bacterium (ex Bugula neritina AB1)]